MIDNSSQTPETRPLFEYSSSKRNEILFPSPDDGVSSGASRLFGVDSATSEIVEFEPTNGAELNRFALPQPSSLGPDGLAFDGNSLYFGAGPAFGGGGILYELDPDTGAVLDSDPFASVGLSDAIDGLGFINGQIVASDTLTSEIFFVDPDSDTVASSFFAPVEIRGGLAGAGSRETIFVNNFFDDEIYELDATTGDLVNTLTDPIDSTFGLAFVDGSLYLGENDTGTIAQLDPDTGSVLNTFASVTSLTALGGDDVVANQMNAIENGSFETGTFEDWRTIGDTSIKTEDFGVTPTDGSFQALLTNGVSASGGSVEAEDLEEFLDLAPGVLDGLGNGPVTEGSAIKQTFDIDEPSILSFDWNFLTDEATPTIFNDFAFFTVNPVTLELADTNFPVFSPSDSLFNEETGYQGVSVAISEPGTYTLSFGVVDVLDEIVDSALLIDNVSVFPISTESTSYPDVFTLGSRDVLALTLGEENIPDSSPPELPGAFELDAMMAERAMMFI
ncbi:MAG: hypothetical protein QNJ65_11780 [Xenococcaceae cyanobacterium MO_234.B1]|nr:hypothetical protein [Xenococcaceae cyanobacterium MO_234.B1]